jgi:hypothetical protein
MPADLILRPIPVGLVANRRPAGVFSTRNGRYSRVSPDLAHVASALNFWRDRDFSPRGYGIAIRCGSLLPHLHAHTGQLTARSNRPAFAIGVVATQSPAAVERPQPCRFRFFAANVARFFSSACSRFSPHRALFIFRPCSRFTLPSLPAMRYRSSRSIKIAPRRLAAMASCSSRSTRPCRRRTSQIRRSMRCRRP